jgi:hypothetical protein
MKMEQTGCSETSADKIQTPVNYPEENIQHSEHGQNLKSRIKIVFDSILLLLVPVTLAHQSPRPYHCHFTSPRSSG